MIRFLSTVFVVLVMAAGCSGSAGNRDAGPGSGGATGAVHCSTSSTECFCSSTGAGSLSECSSDSVALTDHGYCCDGAGFCTCFRVACVSLPSIGYCECGSPLDDTNMRVDNCPQPAGGTCCLDTGLIPYDCHCSDAVTSCPSGQTQVASCSLADVMHCDTTDTVVARCK